MKRVVCFITDMSQLNKDVQRVPENFARCRSNRQLRKAENSSKLGYRSISFGSIKTSFKIQLAKKLIIRRG